jgi:septal ring factor EnvC (AmiA/AmiB activator)
MQNNDTITGKMDQMESKQQQYDEKMEEVQQKCDYQIEQLTKSMETELKVTNKKVHQISEQVKQTVMAHQMKTSM